MESTLHGLIKLSAFVISGLYRIDVDPVYADICAMLENTRERLPVTYLATYYILRISESEKNDPDPDPRTVYIVSFALAIKYVDDHKCVCKDDWAKFAYISNHEFWKTERDILRHLNYNMDPGWKTLEDLFTKLMGMYQSHESITRLIQSLSYPSSASEYRSLASSFSSFLPSLPSLPSWSGLPSWSSLPSLPSLPLLLL
jgi:hypothetical protein